MLARALALRPSDRYTDARALYAALLASVPQGVERRGVGPAPQGFDARNHAFNSTLQPTSKGMKNYGPTVPLRARVLTPARAFGIGITVVAAGVFLGVMTQFVFDREQGPTRRTLLAGSSVTAFEGAPAAPLDADLDARIAHGMELRRQGRNELALEEFRQAYQRSHRPIARAQMALAAQALGRWIEAASDLQGALASVRDPAIQQNRAAFEASYSAIAQHLGRIEVRSGAPGAEVFVNGDRIGSLPLDNALHLLPGSVSLEVRAPGYLPAAREVAVTAGESRVEIIELAPAPQR